MSSCVCFPGGGTDKTDESLEWINFFENHKVQREELRHKPGLKKPLIYNARVGCLDREISLRLTAIRETFEELGVIFCRDPLDSLSASPFSKFYHTKSCDIPMWQDKIHDHKISLLEFCEKFGVIPDILNIHEWSCWLAPPVYRPQRHETVFFLAALDEIPPVYAESSEVQDFQVIIRNLTLINQLTTFIMTSVADTWRTSTTIQREENLSSTTATCGNY